MKEAARAVALDLWIARKFCVLPTDERFKNLTRMQKELLFTGFVEAPLDEDVWAACGEDPMSVNDEDVANFKKLGYTDEQIKNIKKNLGIAQAANRG